jgi:hypothetical protein
MRGYAGYAGYVSGCASTVGYFGLLRTERVLPLGRLYRRWHRTEAVRFGLLARCPVQQGYAPGDRKPP